MPLAREIEERLKAAMKGGRTEEMAALRLIKSELLTKRVELKVADIKDLPDDVVVGVLRGMIKKRENAIELFVQGGRQDLADKEKGEIAAIRTLLPQELSEDDLRQLIREVIAEVGAQGPREMGKVMGALKGREGVNLGLASKLTKELLGG